MGIVVQYHRDPHDLSSTPEQWTPGFKTDNVTTSTFFKDCATAAVNRTTHRYYSGNILAWELEVRIYMHVQLKGEGRKEQLLQLHGLHRA